MQLSSVTLADWRARVEEELAGKSFEQALVRRTDDGIPVAPLYTEPPAVLPRREAPAQRFRICMRHGPGASPEEIAADIEGGADGLWLLHDALPDGLVAPGDLARLSFVFAARGVWPEGAAEGALARLPQAVWPGVALAIDPIGACARGDAALSGLDAELSALGGAARLVAERFPGARAVMVSALPYHDAGSDAAGELAAALSTAARYLEALLAAGLAAEAAARQITVQIAAGRDTFGELCKVRALRVCLAKLFAAAGASSPPRALVHAVCSSRTLTVRDPWVNMLRATTQVFAAVLGGADLITPTAFDEAFGSPSALGRRVARNTCLVLREESALGKVADPAGGSYYLDTLTDALAREAWRRFRELEREGGIAAALAGGSLAASLEAAFQERQARIARRELPILGVTDFANARETLPRPPPPAGDPPRPAGALPARREAAAFERLAAASAAEGGAS